MECGVLVCGMLHNAKCGKLRCDVVVWNCGDEECGICKVLCDCCVMSDVENDAVCCQMWWCDAIKMWWCNAMWNMLWCEIYCDV